MLTWHIFRSKRLFWKHIPSEETPTRTWVPVLRTLTAHWLPPCQEVKRHRKLAWALFVLASAENCFVSFCFSACPDHICSLSFLFHRDFIYQGSRNNRDCGISTQMTEDKTPRELAGSAPWGAKRGVSRAATHPHQALRLRNCDQHWEGASLV